MPRPASLADFLHAWSRDPRPYLSKHLAMDKDKTLVRLDQLGKQSFREHLLKADRFVLSDAFIERAVTRANTTDISKLLAMADLARLPSKPVLVEYDDEVRYLAQVAQGTAPHMPEGQNAKTTDWARAGFLYVPEDEGWDAVHVSSSPTSMPVWPVSSRLTKSGTRLHKVAQRNGVFAKQFLASAWGITNREARGLQFAINEELEGRGFASLDQFFALPFGAWGHASDDTNLRERLGMAMPALAKQNSGSLRLSVVILASLNTVPIRVVHTVAKGTFQYRFRNLPKLDVKTVHIDAKPGHEVHVYDKVMNEATGRHNRRHEVRGHWRDVSRTGAPIVCSHEPADVDGDYALCGKCTRLLRWIEHHERGNEALGWVLHDHYTVA
jgi:hypothetical protein